MPLPDQLGCLTAELALRGSLTNGLNRFLIIFNPVDSIENNVTSISMSTHAAAEELTTAAIHQRNARKKSCYLLLIVAFVAGIVVLAILS
jgi:t-SNARE complex subunit (syntaxin)